MLAEPLLCTGNSIIASFEAQQDAEMVYESLQQLWPQGQNGVNALLVTKSEEDLLQSTIIGSMHGLGYAALAAFQALSSHLFSL